MGNSSTVTLPKGLVEKVGVVAGDLVELNVNEDGEVTLVKCD